jgi:hypothetical protein
MSLKIKAQAYQLRQLWMHDEVFVNTSRLSRNTIGLTEGDKGEKHLCIPVRKTHMHENGASLTIVPISSQLPLPDRLTSLALAGTSLLNREILTYHSRADEQNTTES